MENNENTYNIWRLYIYIHTCIHAYIHRYIHTYIHTYIYRQTDRRTDRQTDIQIYIQTIWLACSILEGAGVGCRSSHEQQDSFFAILFFARVLFVKHIPGQVNKSSLRIIVGLKEVEKGWLFHTVPYVHIPDVCGEQSGIDSCCHVLPQN